MAKSGVTRAATLPVRYTKNSRKKNEARCNIAAHVAMKTACGAWARMSASDGNTGELPPVVPCAASQSGDS